MNEWSVVHAYNKSFAFIWTWLSTYIIWVFYILLVQHRQLKLSSLPFRWYCIQCASNKMSRVNSKQKHKQMKKMKKSHRLALPYSFGFLFGFQCCNAFLTFLLYLCNLRIPSSSQQSNGQELTSQIVIFTIRNSRSANVPSPNVCLPHWNLTEKSIPKFTVLLADVEK